MSQPSLNRAAILRELPPLVWAHAITAAARHGGRWTYDDGCGVLAGTVHLACVLCADQPWQHAGPAQLDGDQLYCWQCRERYSRAVADRWVLDREDRWERAKHVIGKVANA